MLLSINQKKLVYWQLATEGMDVLNIPEEEGYTATEKTDKYDRFTTFVREFAEKLLVGESTGLDFYGENENLRLFDNGNIGPGWWERALDLGRGKISGKNVLPNFEKTTQKDVTAVLDTFMPMYRALKESYDRRPWYQWFTNHAQYTAERDAIRALRGLMMSLTEMPSAHIQAEFEKRRDKGIKSPYTIEERKHLIDHMRKGTTLAIFSENDDAISEVFGEYRNRVNNNFVEHENIIGDNSFELDFEKINVNANEVEFINNNANEENEQSSIDENSMEDNDKEASFSINLINDNSNNDPNEEFEEVKEEFEEVKEEQPVAQDIVVNNSIVDEHKPINEEEQRIANDEEAQRQVEEEAQRQAEEDARRKAEEAEAKRKAEEEEAQRKAEEEAKRKAEEEEAKRKAEEEEAQRKAEEEAKRKAEEEEAQRKAEEEAKRKAEEEEAQRKAEEEAKRKAEEEEAQRKAEEEAKRKAEEEEARRKAEEEAKRKAEEEEARRKAEEEEAQRKAEEEAKRKLDPEAEAARRLKVEQDAAKVIAESQYTHINDVLLKKCEDAVIDKDLTHEVELGLSAIFGKRVPIFEEKRMALFNYASKNMPKNLLELYRMASNNKKNMASRDAAIEMARKVFSTVFPMTDGCGYDVVDRIYVAQEITDVIMKAYSPAAFIPKVFDEAADYFIISHRVVLAEELEKCEVKFNKKSYDIVKERGGDGADGSGKLEAFKKRKSDRNEDKQKEIENIRERAANISDTDYVEDYHIDAYEEQFQYNINDSKVFVESKDAVIKIFEKVDKNIAKSATKAFFRHINFYMPQVYENMKHIANCDGTLGDVMTYMSKEVFKLTYDHADAYILNKECRLALAQQLADEILTKFSPVNYSNACKGDYAKNFVIGNAANLKEVLGDNANLSDEEINKLKDDAVYASEHLDELVKAEAERRAEEARRKAEEEEAQRKAEEEAKRKAEEEEAQRKAEEEAKRKAEEEEAERKAEEEAKRKAEEEEAQRKAEEEAKRKAEEEDAKRKAEEEAKANEQPKEEPKPEENKAEEPKVDAEEEAKKKAEEEQRKLEISKNAAERKERWNIERQAQLEAANQIENQKQIADEMNGAYQRKLEEKKLAGVGIHELVETEIAFEETGLPEFRLEVSSRLKRMYIYNTVQTSIDKILEKDIPDRDERTEIANNTADIIRRKMVALYSTAEEKKIDIFNNHESFQCLVDTFKEVYKLTDNCGLDFTRHIIIAQKITDSVMQNWSPAPKNNARNVTLFNGYFMQNSYALKGIIPGYDKSLHWKDIEKEFKKDATLHKSVIQARNADKRRKKELSDRLNSETSGVKDNTVIDDSQFEVFTKLFEHNVAVDEVQKKFKDAAADILKEIDPKVKNRSSKLLKEVSFDVSKIYHDLNKYIQHGGTFNDIMTYMAKKTFELCYYNYLKNDNLSQEKRIELSQKLSNVIMERFSPIVGTSKSSVSKDNYMDLVIKNEKLLGDILAKSEKDKAMSKEIENLKKEEAKKKAAELDAKRNYKRQVENPIDVPKRLEKSFVVACEEELENSLKDSQLSEAFKLQVAKVLEKMGLDKSKAEECANKVFKDVSGNSKGMRNIYNVMEDDVKTKYDPESFTKHMMDFLTNNFSKTVTDYFENVDVGIIASRNVMGVILRNYSPAAFTKGDAFNNGINSCLFDENGRIFLINYYYHYYNRDIHGDKRAHYNSAGEFVEKIQTNTEKYLKEEIKYERKLMDKYERKVEGVKLSKEDGDTLITMADLNVFKEECKNSIADPNLTEYVKWQIGEILADSGLEDAKIQSTIDNIFEKCTSDSGMLGFYDKANTSVYLQNYSKDNADMVMKKMLTDGMKLVSKATDGCYSNVEEGMAVNQKVLNVIFKNYSPVAFTNGALNKFAEDYFTTNTSMFGDYYRYNINDVGGWDQMRGIFDNFKAAVARLNNKAPVNEPAINDDEQPAPAEEKKEEAPAEEKKEEAPAEVKKEEAPTEVKKEEAPAEVKKEEAPTEVKKENVEPEKVKIVVHELIEAVGGKEVSPKIEEDSVSVASNKQK